MRAARGEGGCREGCRAGRGGWGMARMCVWGRRAAHCLCALLPCCTASHSWQLYGRDRCCRAGSVLFKLDDPAEAFFIVERGTGGRLGGGAAECWAAAARMLCQRCRRHRRSSSSHAQGCASWPPPAFVQSVQPLLRLAAPCPPAQQPPPLPPPPAVASHVDFALSSVASRAQLPALPPDLQPQHGERLVLCGPGSVLGDVDFMLQRPFRQAGLQRLWTVQCCCDTPVIWGNAEWHAQVPPSCGA